MGTRCLIEGKHCGGGNVAPGGGREPSGTARGEMPKKKKDFIE